MSMLINTGLIVIGLTLGFLLTVLLLALGVRDNRILVLFSKQLKQYEVLIGVVGKKGKVLWRRPMIKSLGDAFVWSGDINLDEWK